MSRGEVTRAGAVRVGTTFAGTTRGGTNLVGVTRVGTARFRMTRSASLLLALILALAACGKVGPPLPAGPADKVTWPRNYPKPTANGY